MFVTATCVGLCPNLYQKYVDLPGSKCTQSVVATVDKFMFMVTYKVVIRKASGGDKQVLRAQYGRKAAMHSEWSTVIAPPERSPGSQKPPDVSPGNPLGWILPASFGEAVHDVPNATGLHISSFDDNSHDGAPIWCGIRSISHGPYDPNGPWPCPQMTSQD